MNSIAPSELIINGDGSVFHLHIKPEELADTVILVGDPGRVELVSSYFDSKEFTRSSREFVTVTGNYKGKRITVLSTGIGTDNIDIVVNELDALANIDFKTRKPKEKHRRLKLLRIGTSGAIQADIPIGSFVLSHISVGCDGLLNWYAGRDRVTIADMEKAFVLHTGWLPELPAPYFAPASKSIIDSMSDFTLPGVTISASGFYAPQGRVLRLPLAMPDMVSKFESFRFKNHRITNFEMEGSAIAGLATLLGHDAATVCCIIANRYLHESQPDYKPFIKRLIELSLERL
ncbi:MAG: phosphorylase [Bacteroidetes bacterium GWE2_39_28]|nr:MAG: phosphorylase [Bacteroidetes bacterium GWE2_39_28]OFY13668.1 MAG: phosphorylase [Bacteroidetes bacterium GWF2_39_10]OFZ08506.1 MAG: phosphorylase [Bacteroidetes bacterium RIFOXYB2_FULL_39_7]OFZ11840.1 MAG: phosphorylase [Bacteroidetes bacterium RIFOXYC2_FULL_39_11]HCT94107.1 phosphorylase [Rikenellaceae bacterium]